jgi:acetyl-CoA synthetase
MNDLNQKPIDRVRDLLATYSDQRASTARLLCDRHDPSRVAYVIVAPDMSAEELTYGALREESERLANVLWSFGLRTGDRIGTLMGKSRTFLVTVMAIWRLGAVHLPLFTAFAPPAIRFRLTASGCKLVICDALQRPKLETTNDVSGSASLRIITTGIADSGALAYTDLLANGMTGFPPIAMGGDAPIIQLYTSGTTGVPKGVMVPLRAVASFQTYAEYSLGLGDDDIFWNAADPGWAYGLYLGIVATFSTGVRSVLFQGGFSAETTFCVLSRYGVTNFAAAPTVFRSLRASGAKAPSNLKLRCASSAGEPLTPEVNQWATSSLGVPVHDHYGQTEAGMLINNHHHSLLRRPLKQGSMGHAMPGWQAAILKPNEDEPASAGELGRVAMDLSQSPLAWFDGYVDDPQRSEEKFSADDRWYFTGDSGRMDEDGYFFFASRDDDVITMAGYRIGPFEIESILVDHPAVSECAVVAAPDEIRGEVLEAFVVLQKDTAPSDVLTVDLQGWVRKRYGTHAYPRRVHYVGALPKTPSGKVQRFILRQQLRQKRTT